MAVAGFHTSTDARFRPQSREERRCVDRPCSDLLR